jgi:hypothetical protein
MLDIMSPEEIGWLGAIGMAVFLVLSVALVWWHWR